MTTKTKKALEQRRARRKWTEEADELLYGLYGMHPARTVAAIINSRLDMSFTPRAVAKRAHDLGIQAANAQGYLSIADAAREIGVKPNVLWAYIKRHNIKVMGTGAFRLLTHETLQTLRGCYVISDEPTVTPPEAARILHYSSSEIHRLLNTGRIRAHRYGYRWRIPISEVNRMLQERRRAG